MATNNPLFELNNSQHGSTKHTNTKPTTLTQAVENLFSNNINYTPSEISWWECFLGCAFIKRFSLRQFQVSLFIVFAMNILAICSEIGALLYYKNTQLGLPNEYGVLCIVATVFALINASLIAKLILQPTTKSALVSCAIILILGLVYIAQLIISNVEVDHDSPALLSLNIIYIVGQVLTTIILYRYWEYVYYVYDGSSNSSSLRSSLYEGDAPIQSAQPSPKIKASSKPKTPLLPQ